MTLGTACNRKLEHGAYILTQCSGECLCDVYPGLADAAALTESTVLQVCGRHSSGTIVFNDVRCTDNSAVGNGGCFHGSGKATFKNRTVMLNNQGINGGGICEYNSCIIGVCFIGGF